MSIQVYLSLFYEKLRNIRSWVPEETATHRGYRTIAAFEVSFEALEREHYQAADLLLTCAFLHHDNIPNDLIRRGLGDNGEWYTNPTFKSKYTKAEANRFEDPTNN